MRLIDADDVDNHIVGSVNLSGCPTINAISIPEDATNGDAIKAMFPKSKTVQLTHMTIAMWYEVIGDCGKWVNYQIDWWNAPYKAESEEEDV